MLTGQDDQLAAQRPRRRAQRQVGRPTTSCSRCTADGAADRGRAGARTARRGSVVALDVHDRRGARDVLEPHVQPERPARSHDTQVVQNTFNQINTRRQGRAAARVPRALPAGFDVQGRHQQVGASRPGSRPPTTRSSPTRTASRSRGPTPRCCNFGGRARAAARSTRASSSRATRPSPQLGYELGDAFPPAHGAVRRSTSAPPIDLEPGAVGERRPARSATRQAALRARRDRPGRRVHVAAADGADRRGIANGGVIKEPHVVKEIQQHRRQDRAHHRRRRTGRRACSRPRPQRSRA